MTGEARLHLVDDARGKRGSFGDVQAEWLLAQGIVERTGYERTGPATAVVFYRVLDERTIEQIDDAVMAEVSMRECDFCRVIPAEWVLNVRPFEMPIGPGGMIRRPIFVCGECEPFVRATDKPRLIERLIDSTFERAIALGGEAAAAAARVSSEQIRRNLSPQVRDFVNAVFHNRQGYPELADA